MLRAAIISCYDILYYLIVFHDDPYATLISLSIEPNDIYLLILKAIKAQISIIRHVCMLSLHIISILTVSVVSSDPCYSGSSIVTRVFFSFMIF